MWLYCGDLAPPHAFLVIGCHPITSDCDSRIISFPVSNLESRCKSYRRSKWTSSCSLSNYTCSYHITQQHAAAPWGWEFCEHDAPFMSGLPYKMNNTQPDHCSFRAFEVAFGNCSGLALLKMECMFINIFYDGCCQYPTWTDALSRHVCVMPCYKPQPNIAS